MGQILTISFFEGLAVILLIIGFIYEDKVIAFEDMILWFWKECKRQGRTKVFFFKGLITCCIKEIKERVGS